MVLDWDSTGDDLDINVVRLSARRGGGARRQRCHMAQDRDRRCADMELDR